MRDSEFAEVYNARNLTEAELLRQMLEADGIWAEVINASLQSAVGDLPYLAVSPRVRVRREDSERARHLVLALQQSRHRSPQEDWNCPRCNETNGPAFDFCWNCTWQRDRDTTAT
jgi:hypothetical protein